MELKGDKNMALSTASAAYQENEIMANMPVNKDYAQLMMIYSDGLKAGKSIQDIKLQLKSMYPQYSGFIDRVY